MNSSSDIVSIETMFSLEITTVLVGFLILVINGAIVAVLAKLLFELKSRTNKEKHSIHIHTLFVCVNDMLAGLVLGTLGFLRVKEHIRANICVYTAFASFAFQLVSQGNITCICFQRYSVLKNITNTLNGQRFVQTKLLLSVNIGIGVLAFLSFVLFSPVKDPPYSDNGFCNVTDLINGDAAMTLVFFFIFGLIFTIISDVFCIISVCKLRTDIKVAVQTSHISAMSGTHSSGHSALVMDTDVHNRLKVRQRKATITVCLIAFFFNLAIFPIICSFILNYTGSSSNILQRRIIHISTFLNSLINPFIVAFRVENIAMAFRKMFNKIRNALF